MAVMFNEMNLSHVKKSPVESTFFYETGQKTMSVNTL